MYGVILSKASAPLKVSKKLPVVSADDVQWLLMSRGADADRLSTAVCSAMMVSLMGHARMACSSASFATPPLHMTVTFVVRGVLFRGEVLQPRPFVLVGVVCLAAAVAYRGWVFIHGWGATLCVGGVAVDLPPFRAASAGVGSGRGGMGGGGVAPAGGGGGLCQGSRWGDV